MSDIGNNAYDGELERARAFQMMSPQAMYGAAMTAQEREAIPRDIASGAARGLYGSALTAAEYEALMQMLQRGGGNLGSLAGQAVGGMGGGMMAPRYMTGGSF